MEKIMGLKKKFIIVFWFIVGFLFFGFGNSFSFGQDRYLFPSFHNYSELLFYTHIDIGTNYERLGTISNIVDVIIDLKKHNIIDISSYGWLTPEGYNLAKLQLYTAKRTYNNLKTKLNSLKTRELHCWNKKKLYDKKFFSALKFLGSSSMEKSIQSAIEYEQCATEMRVRYNSYKKIYDILERQYNIFSRRYDYWKARRVGIKEF